jgi:3'(2'), 5'-bisphosphate nucleotidase/myo-inositol-1(or 4)-monophosphatase
MLELEMDLHSLCQHAIQAALRAGSIIDHYRERNVKIEHKAEGGSAAAQVVTEVDYKAQQAIIETLTPTLEQYDLALLAEESPDDGLRFHKSAFWCIDPMDGTLAFIRNVPAFSVSIALVDRNGEALIGVVYDPVNKDTYHAIKGAGAFKNNQPIEPSPLNPKLPLVLCTDISFKTHPQLQRTQEGLKEIAAALGLAGTTIDFRIGAVMNAIYTLSYANICYFKYARGDNKGGSIWDYAATACLFLEAGATACDINGNPMDLNRPDSSFMNHRGLIYSPSRELSEKIIALNHRLEDL